MALLTPKGGPSAELEKLCRRYLELREQHGDATGARDDDFYDDGRHQELIEVQAAIYASVGLKPWYRNPAAHVRQFLGEEVSAADLE